MLKWLKTPLQRIGFLMLLLSIILSLAMLVMPLFDRSVLNYETIQKFEAYKPPANSGQLALHNDDSHSSDIYGEKCFDEIQRRAVDKVIGKQNPFLPNPCLQFIVKDKSWYEEQWGFSESNYWYEVGQAAGIPILLLIIGLPLVLGIFDWFYRCGARMVLWIIKLLRWVGSGKWAPTNQSKIGENELQQLDESVGPKPKRRILSRILLGMLFVVLWITAIIIANTYQIRLGGVPTAALVLGWLWLFAKAIGLTTARIECI